MAYGNEWLVYLLYRRELSYFEDRDEGDTERSLYRFGDKEELLDLDLERFRSRFERYFPGDTESRLDLLLLWPAGERDFRRVEFRLT